MGLDWLALSLLLLWAMVYVWLLPARLRSWALMGASVVSLFAFQPMSVIQWVDFSLPILSLCLTFMVWLSVRPHATRPSREDYMALGLALLIVGILASLRFVPASYRIIVASRPPDPLFLLALISIGAVLAWALRYRIGWLIGLLVAVFVLLKSETLLIAVNTQLRAWAGMETQLASSADFVWVGFSYLAFRLIHTLRDKQTGLLPDLGSRDFITYVLFFPALLAGPIDRAERFLGDMQALNTLNLRDAERINKALFKIASGIAKKFVLADWLAQGLSLSAENALATEHTWGTWILVYGYALRLFFDFSGYSDMAIGLAMLFGVQLPENFDAPYTRLSITKFWQSWHISLSNWARFYVFSPLSRALLSRKPKPPTAVIVLVSHLATMLLIGLWHGITWNFAIWGIWQALGLWVHKQWTDNTRPLYRRLQQRPRLARLADVLAWGLTFHYVVLGWLWFALPDIQSVWHVAQILVGIGTG